jgi:serine/threonine protein kinase
MYQRLSDCPSVVTLFEATEGVTWTIAGKGLCRLFLFASALHASLGSFPSEESNASVLVMERGKGNVEELKNQYKVCVVPFVFAMFELVFVPTRVQPQAMSSAADPRPNVVDQMTRCVASLHNRKEPVSIPRGWMGFARSPLCQSRAQIVWGDLKLENFLVFATGGVITIKMVARLRQPVVLILEVVLQVDFESAVLSGQPMQACTPVYTPPELAAVQGTENKIAPCASTKHDGA